MLTPRLTVGQLPQTSYHSLLTPYSFFGLGRTNNYIENLFVGSTKHAQDHFINMEGVIPNSRVVIHPPPGLSEGSWKRELFLRPGQWIPWVTLTVVVATAILAIIVFILHLNEKVCLPLIDIGDVTERELGSSVRTSWKEEERHIISILTRYRVHYMPCYLTYYGCIISSAGSTHLGVDTRKHGLVFPGSSNYNLV